MKKLITILSLLYSYSSVFASQPGVGFDLDSVKIQVMSSDGKPVAGLRIGMSVTAENYGFHFTCSANRVFPKFFCTSQERETWASRTYLTDVSGVAKTEAFKMQKFSAAYSDGTAGIYLIDAALPGCSPAQAVSIVDSTKLTMTIDGQVKPGCQMQITDGWGGQLGQESFSSSSLICNIGMTSKEFSDRVAMAIANCAKK